MLKSGASIYVNGFKCLTILEQKLYVKRISGSVHIFFFQNEVPTIFIIMKRLAFYVDLLKLFIQLIKFVN